LASGTPTFEAHDLILIFYCLTFTSFLRHVGRPLWREDGSVAYSGISQRSESAEPVTIFYTLSSETPPHLEGQVPVFVSPRNKVAQSFPRALGSLFVAIYNYQGCGGGILTSLHSGSRGKTEIKLNMELFLRPTVSRPVRLGIGPPSGYRDKILITVGHSLFFLLGRPP
jgi:hypothetical protein